MSGFSARNVRWTARWTFILTDAVAFLLFAGLGRHEHQESGGAWSALITAAPFLVAWFPVAGFFGVLSNEWLRRGSRAFRSVGLAWLIAWPMALLLRAVFQRRGIPLSFDLVALVVNASFLLGWRGIYLFAVRRAWRTAMVRQRRKADS